MAVTLALALSACATTNTVSSTVDAMPTATSKASVTPVPMMDKTGDGDVMTSEVSRVSEPTAQEETLLYGAMTKFELMKFVEAVTNADLSAALETDTPVTVFAPNNDALERTPEGLDASLLKGHIIAGAMDAATLMEAVQQNGGPVTYTSLAGTKLTVHIMDDKVKISGPSNMLATVSQADMVQSNGVMHQINGVIK